MTMTDPIADMLTRIRNAQLARHTYTDIPASRLKKAIAEILADEGYIKGFAELDSKYSPGKVLRVDVKYRDAAHGAIDNIQRVSRPGRRVYKPAKEMPRVRGGLGIAIVSTSQGLMTARKARAANVGGEVLCQVW